MMEFWNIGIMAKHPKTRPITKARKLKNTKEEISRRDAKSAENGSLVPMWRLPNGEISGLVSPFFSLHIPPLLAQFQPLRSL